MKQIKLSAEEQLQRLVSQLKAEKDALSSKIQKQDQELSELLIYSEMVVVESTLDMKILNYYGDIEYVFENVAKQVECGANLTMLVAKATQETKSRADDSDKEDIIDVVTKFVQSPRTEKKIEILGVKDESGELFLLDWKMKKTGKMLKSYFKITPTNNIIKQTTEKFERALDDKDKFYGQVFEYSHRGVTILNPDGKIIYINTAAKDMFVSSDNKLIKTESLIGRTFYEIFINDDAETTKERQAKSNQAYITKSSVSFIIRTHDGEIKYEIHPLLDRKRNVAALSIFTTLLNSGQNNTLDSKKLMSTLKTLYEEKSVLAERIKELEYNHQWLMKNSRDVDNQRKKLYFFLNSLPIPISVVDLKTKKYDFVNREFELKIKKKRDDIIGFREVQVFTQIEADFFDNLLLQGIESKDAIQFSGLVFEGVQSTIKSQQDTPLFAIRVFTKIK
jgi:PAS domain S-box-containing protein